MKLEDLDLTPVDGYSWSAHPSGFLASSNNLISHCHQARGSTKTVSQSQGSHFQGLIFDALSDSMWGISYLARAPGGATWLAFIGYPSTGVHADDFYRCEN
jgi:hypothetical protein